MDMKNDATVICPNCGTEMVKARFEVEGGWIHGWLCECEQGAMSDAAININKELILLKRTIELLVEAGHVTQDDVSKARRLAFSLSIVELETMTTIGWIREGMPLDVPFTLVRAAYVDTYSDLERAADGVTRDVALAVEYYRGQCGATKVEYLEMGGGLADLWPTPQGDHIYVALAVTRPGLLRAGARVCMRC